MYPLVLTLQGRREKGRLSGWPMGPGLSCSFSSLYDTGLCSEGQAQAPPAGARGAVSVPLVVCNGSLTLEGAINSQRAPTRSRTGQKAEAFLGIDLFFRASHLYQEALQ